MPHPELCDLGSTDSLWECDPRLFHRILTSRWILSRKRIQPQHLSVGLLHCWRDHLLVP